MDRLVGADERLCMQVWPSVANGVGGIKSGGRGGLGWCAGCEF